MEESGRARMVGEGEVVVNRRVLRWGIACYLALIFATLSLAPRGIRWLWSVMGRENFGMAASVALALLAGGAVWRIYRNGQRRWMPVLGPMAVTAGVVWMLDNPVERLHFLEYGVLGVLVFLERGVGRTALLQGALFLVLAGACDELIQHLMASRVGDWRDVGMNALAGWLGLWLGRYLFPNRPG